MQVRLLKQQPWWPALALAVTIRHIPEPPIARGGDPGCWFLAYYGNVIDGECTVERWWSKTDDAFWRECGFPATERDIAFPHKPGLSTVYQRFHELEQFDLEIQATTKRFWDRARQYEPDLFRLVHFDAREAEAHVKLRHDCGEGDDCPTAKPGELRGRVKKPRRMSSEEARTARAAWPEQVGDDAHTAAPPATEHGVMFEIDGYKMSTAAIEGHTTDEGRHRVKLGGHWWLTTDPDVGWRAYERPGQEGKRRVFRFWVGYYHMAAIEGVTGATVAIEVAPANKNELHIYPDALERLERLVPDLSKTIVTGDKGLSFTSVFRLNSQRGAASAIPLRKDALTGKTADQVEFDRHGAKRCDACGRPCRQVRFSEKQGLRTWHVCEKPSQLGCFRRDQTTGEVLGPREQTLRCAADWRRVLPLSRLSLTCQEAVVAHSNREHAHHDRDRRYEVGGADKSNRLKLLGKGAQQLRASVCCLAEIVRISYRMGWLGNSPKRALKKVRRYTKKAAQRLEELIADRQNCKLDLPYGPAAFANGGELLPPSARPRGDPAA